MNETIQHHFLCDHTPDGHRCNEINCRLLSIPISCAPAQTAVSGLHPTNRLLRITARHSRERLLVWDAAHTPSKSAHLSGTFRVLLPSSSSFKMWNDEDNNPYGDGFDRRDSFTSSSANPTSPTTRECELLHNTVHNPQQISMIVPIVLDDSSDDADSDWETLDPRYDAPQTPSTTSDEAPPRPSFAGESTTADSDEEAVAEAEAEARGELVPRRKAGGYDSRIEQMLYENPELPILITEAGKSSESGGRYIVYTIKTGVRCLELQSLSFALTTIMPTGTRGSPTVF